MLRTKKAYDIWVILFLLTALSGLAAGYDWQAGLRLLAALLGGSLLYFVLSRWGGGKRAWTISTAVLTGAGALVALYFITQAGHLEYAEKVDLISRAAGWIARITPDWPFWKPQTNSVATFLEGILFSGAVLFFRARKRTERWGWGAACAVIGLGIGMSASRGAWLGILLAALIWLSIRRRTARIALLILGAGLGGLVLFVLARGSIFAINDLPVVSGVLGPLFIRPDRLEVYRNSLALIGDAPFTGIGLNQFGMVYSRYELIIPYLFLSYAHNLLLEVWLEQGIVGLLAWSGLIITIYVQAVTHRDAGEKLRFEATWAGITAILLHELTDARVYADPWCWLPFYALLGLNAALIMKTEIQHRWASWITPGALAAGALAFCAIFWPLPAALNANLGSLAQERADLSPGLPTAERQNLLADAEGFFQRALAAQPGQRAANQRLGMILLDRFDLSGAISALERALQADPSHPGTRKALGLAYTFDGQVDRAEPLLRSAPNIVEELNYWGWYWGTQNKPGASLGAYRLSLRIDPSQKSIQNQVEALSKANP